MKSESGRHQPLLQVTNLHAVAGGVPILKGIDLEVEPGEVHAIMGPNGSGKTTLASVLAGRDSFETTAGSVSMDGKDLLAMTPEERGAIREKLRQPIDTASIPKYEERQSGLTEVINRALPYVLLLVLFGAVFFAGAFVSFLRYDVR